MNNSKIHFARCVFILLTFLVGCVGITPKESKTTIQLKPCSLGWREAQCGTLRVYENRTVQSGRMIDLNIVVIEAQSDDPAPDPIFYLAGGPGDAATEDARRQQFPFSLSQNHDLVFVDQRGTGGSNRVVIPNDSPDLAGLSPDEMDIQAKAWVARVLREIDMDPQFCHLGSHG
jgi:hypothetical protein